MVCSSDPHNRTDLLNSAFGAAGKYIQVTLHPNSVSRWCVASRGDSYEPANGVNVGAAAVKCVATAERTG